MRLVKSKMVKSADLAEAMKQEAALDVQTSPVKVFGAGGLLSESRLQGKSAVRGVKGNGIRDT